MNDQNLNQFDGGLGGGDNSSGDKGNGGGPSKNPKKQNIQPAIKQFLRPHTSAR